MMKALRGLYWGPDGPKWPKDAPEAWYAAETSRLYREVVKLKPEWKKKFGVRHFASCLCTHCSKEDASYYRAAETCPWCDASAGHKSLRRLIGDEQCAAFGIPEIGRKFPWCECAFEHPPRGYKKQKGGSRKKRWVELHPDELDGIAIPWCPETPPLDPAQRKKLAWEFTLPDGDGEGEAPEEEEEEAPFDFGCEMNLDDLFGSPGGGPSDGDA